MKIYRGYDKGVVIFRKHRRQRDAGWNWGFLFNPRNQHKIVVHFWYRDMKYTSWVNWKCPYCGADNTDNAQDTLLPLCGACDKQVFWNQILKSTARTIRASKSIHKGEK